MTWAAKRGIVEGMTATTFDPNDAVTREELAAMLYRYAKHKATTPPRLRIPTSSATNDALSISEYAFEALQWACGEGIINGNRRRQPRARRQRHPRPAGRDAVPLLRRVRVLIPNPGANAPK